MKKKVLLVLGMAALLSLGSCGNSRRYTEVNQPLPEDVPTDGAVTIEFWHCLGHEKAENLKTRIVNPFNEKYEGKYFVKLTKLSGGYDELNESIKKKLAAGEVPALSMGYPDSFAGYMTKTETLSSILRLNTWIEDDRPVIPAETDEDGNIITPASDEIMGYTADELTGDTNGFVKGYLNEGNSYHFGGYWSMPMYKSTEIMYYNLNYFKGCNELNSTLFYGIYDEFDTLYDKVVDQAGTDTNPNFWTDLDALETWCKDMSKHPDQEAYTYNVPVTWTDAITLARKMKADRQLVLGPTDTFTPFGYDSDANLMISQMEQRGIPYTVNDEDSQANPRNHFKFVNAQAKALAEEIVGYINNEKIMITKNSLGGTTYTNTKFSSGEAAFVVGSTGGSSYNISASFAVGLAPVPYSNNNPKYIQQGPSICFFDNNKPQVHKGAWLFYKALADVENNAVLALDNSYDPVRIGSYETDYYLDWIDFANHPEYKGVLLHEIPVQTRNIKQYYMTSPVFIGSGEARNQMGQILNNMISGATADSAFDDAYSNCIIAVK